VVTEINIIWKPVKSSIGEQTNNTSIVVVILSRSICVEKSQPDYRITEPLLEIHDLNFVHPLRNGIIIVLNNGMVEGNVFRKDLLVLVTINLR
jgi:hypothetical protein